MLQISPEDYARLQDRVKNRTGLMKKAKPQGRKNKYGAEATECDGIRFDSKSEARRYLTLKTMEKAGEISDLQLQVRIPLLPAQEIDGRKEKPVDYICDFVFVRDGVKVYEDVKSGPTKTREFVLKRKLCLYMHGIAVQEVMVD
jgi:hypothetical protein